MSASLSGGMATSFDAAASSARISGSGDMASPAKRAILIAARSNAFLMSPQENVIGPGACLRFIFFRHHEDGARQCRSDGKRQDESTHRHNAVRVCAVAIKKDDARRVDQDQRQREQQAHRDAHGGVGNELGQPGGREQSWRLIGAHDRPPEAQMRNASSAVSVPTPKRISEIFVSLTKLTSAATKPASSYEPRVGEPACSIRKRLRCCALSSMSCARTSPSRKPRHEPALLPESWRLPPKESGRSTT